MEPECCPALREQNVGHIEGLSWEEMGERYPDARHNFIHNWHETTPPGGESPEEMLARVAACVDGIIARGEAVNEIVVKNARPSTVLHLAAESGGRRLYSFRGDGIIAATPTGTTAYTLSAGGPVVDPQARAVIVTPICAHSLVARSVVLAPEGGARIELLSSGQGAGILAADGRDSIALQPGDIVECRESRRDLLLASLKEIPFFDIMRNKLSGEAGESL